MTTMDPHDRIEMTGPWAGFGFQGGHMFTPEGHSLQPCDMTWWSLTCNIAREWRPIRAYLSWLFVGVVGWAIASDCDADWQPNFGLCALLCQAGAGSVFVGGSRCHAVKLGL
ncbi:DUF3653 domain-containing protein [Stenotrophomonas sp. AS1]|uniref:DUF3653 domain-containing protein n=1 Tax=Stenotrophomonas sp. AS1 TaxID=3029188 RepID=UPI003B7901BB